MPRRIGGRINVISGPIGAPGLRDESAYWAPDGLLGGNVPTGDGLTGGTADVQAVIVIATYHSASLYWQPASGGSAVTCEVNYRPVGATLWRVGHELYWDDFTRNLAQPPEQYKGSLLHLKPGTAYEGRLKLSNGQFRDFNFTTKTDPSELPIDGVTLLPGTSTATLTLDATDTGAPDGYHLITFDPANGGAEIDVSDLARYCVDVQGTQFVILRGLTLKNASYLGIFLQDGCENLIIDRCDISGWGSGPGSVAGFGQTRDGAVSNEDINLGARNTDIGKITVQRCTIHDPRWDSNAWNEPTDPTHPQGPSATFFATTNGENVFRYNHIFGSGDEAVKYNDGLTGGFNDTDAGFPGQGSDIYGNIIRECWDDGIECDGGGDMVRIWGNYIDTCYHGISISPNHKGIVYVFRNVVDRVRRTTAAQASNNGGGFIKMQSFIVANSYGFGRNMVFNNTVLQTGGDVFGGRFGVGPDGATGRAPRNTWTRNNILETADLNGIAWSDDAGNANGNDYDYDLYNNGIDAYTGAETNGIAGSPTYLNGTPPYSPTAPTGDYELDPTSPASNGYEDGIFLKGLTLNPTSPTPDMGAHEKGTGLLRFGPNAFV